MSNARVYVGHHGAQPTGPSAGLPGAHKHGRPGLQAAATLLVGVWQELQSSEQGQRMVPTGKPQGRTSKLVGTKGG